MEPRLVRAVDIKLKSVQGIGVNERSCCIDCRNDGSGLRLVAQQVSDNRVPGLVVRRGFDLRFSALYHWVLRRAAGDAGRPAGHFTIRLTQPLFTSPWPKSDISDLGRLMAPNSGLTSPSSGGER